MSFALGFAVAMGLIASCIGAFFIGCEVIASDAEKRLKRELPVDDFWRKRGMK